MSTWRLGDTAPDFEQASTEGPIHCHAWLGQHWGVLFSHPADFTPVCTTELGRTAHLKTAFWVADAPGHRPALSVGTPVTDSEVRFRPALARGTEFWIVGNPSAAARTELPAREAHGGLSTNISSQRVVYRGVRRSCRTDLAAAPWSMALAIDALPMRTAPRPKRRLSVSTRLQCRRGSMPTSRMAGPSWPARQVQ
jgi:hypothetical protein